MFARFAFQVCSFNRHWNQDQAVQNGQFDEERSVQETASVLMLIRLLKVAPICSG